MVFAILLSTGMLMRNYEQRIERKTITLERFTYHFWEYKNDKRTTVLNFSFELIQGDDVFFFCLDETTYLIWKKYGDLYGEMSKTINGKADVVIELKEKQTYYFGFYPIGLNLHSYVLMEVDQLRLGMFFAFPVTINIVGLLYLTDIEKEFEYRRKMRKVAEEALDRIEQSRRILQMNPTGWKTEELVEMFETIQREVELKEVVKEFHEEEKQIPEKFLKIMEEKIRLLRKTNLWELEKEELEFLGEKIQKELTTRYKS